MAKPSAKRKPRKPGILRTAKGRPFASMTEDGWIQLDDELQISPSLAKRLQPWLGRAIAYLEAKKGGG